MTVRVVLAAVAIAAVAWLAVMERDTRLLAGGVKAAGRAGRAQAFRRADADFRAATFLNPDAEPELGRALLYDAAGRPDAAAVLDRILRREPDNLTAWGLRYAVARAHGDRLAARRALAAQRRLDPVNARRR